MTWTGKIPLIVHLHSTDPAICHDHELRQIRKRAEEGWKEEEEK
jgi:hypothetical protein